MKEYKFLVPVVQDDTREPHAEWVWEYVQTQLLNIGGGFSEGSRVQGQWRDQSGKIIADECRQFLIALPPHKESWLRVMLEWCCRMCHQECLYLADNAGSVDFIEPVTRESVAANMDMVGRTPYRTPGLPLFASDPAGIGLLGI